MGRHFVVLPDRSVSRPVKCGVAEAIWTERIVSALKRVASEVQKTADLSLQVRDLSDKNNTLLENNRAFDEENDCLRKEAKTYQRTIQNVLSLRQNAGAAIADLLGIEEPSEPIVSAGGEAFTLEFGARCTIEVYPFTEKMYVIVLGSGVQYSYSISNGRLHREDASRLAKALDRPEVSLLAFLDLKERPQNPE